MGHVLRRALLATVAAAVLVGFVATFASAAAKPNNPQITFTDPASDAGLLTSGKSSSPSTGFRMPQRR